MIDWLGFVISAMILNDLDPLSPRVLDVKLSSVTLPYRNGLTGFFESR